MARDATVRARVWAAQVEVQGPAEWVKGHIVDALLYIEEICNHAESQDERIRELEDELRMIRDGFLAKWDGNVRGTSDEKDVDSINEVLDEVSRLADKGAVDGL